MNYVSFVYHSRDDAEKMCNKLNAAGRVSAYDYIKTAMEIINDGENRTIPENWKNEFFPIGTAFKVTENNYGSFGHGKTYEKCYSVYVPEIIRFTW